MKIFDKIRLNDRMRPLVVKQTANLRVKDSDFSIISSNCNGGVLLHDLGMRFNSPFVDLWIRPADYCKLLENFEVYMQKDLSFSGKSYGVDYPVGELGDVILFFQHYATKEEASAAWYRRRNRINYDKLYIMFTDRDGCDEAILKRFDSLEYKKKLVFTHREQPEIKSSFYIKGFEEDGQVGILSEYIPGKIGKRFFDVFDFASWIDGDDR